MSSPKRFVRHLGLFVVAALSNLGCSGDLDGTDPSGGEEVSQSDEAIYVYQVPLFNDTFTADVCFLDPGYASERATIRSTIEQTWETVSGLDFRDFGDCTGDPNAISIDLTEDGPTDHAEPGRGARRWENPDAQIIIGLNPNRDFIRTTTSHEVGHAIGFIHEHQRPDRDAANLCFIDPADTTNGDQAVLSGGITMTGYDLDSIMNYCRDWDHNGDDDYQQGDDFWQLSPLDIAGAKLLYGLAPNERATREAAFVTTQQLTGNFTPAPTMQWNTTGQTNTVEWLGTGQYKVLFPGVGSALGGNVQVTSVQSGSRHCNIASWVPNGSALEVRVNCYLPNGNRDNAMFSASYVARADTPGSEGGYVWANDATSTTPYNPDSFYSWNSTGQAITAVNTGITGRYDVTFNNQGIPGGTVQVTAYSQGSEYCKILGWGFNVASVACFSTTGQPANTLFSLRFTQGSPNGTPSYAYAYAEQQTNPGPYVADLTWQKTFQAHSIGGSEVGGRVTVTRTQAGMYRATFSGMAWDPELRFATANVQVAAYGGLNANRCVVDAFGGTLSHGFANIHCFTPSGTFADSIFVTTFSSLLTKGQPQVLAHSRTGLPSARGMAVDSTMVTYGETGTNGQVRRVNVNGGVQQRHDPNNLGPLKQVTLADVTNGPFAVTANSTTAFFTKNATSGGGVFKVSLSGGATTQLWSGSGARALVVNGSNVYFTTAPTPSTGTVRKVPVNGGSATTLASSQGDPVALATDGTNVYWTNVTSGTLRKISVNGGMTTTLASSLSQPNALVIDSGSTGSVFFLTSGDGSVRKISKTGGSVTLLAVGQPAPLGMALDSGFVYYGDAQAGLVKKVDRTSGKTLVVASGQSSPRVNAVDSTSVYFSTTDENVKKAAKQ